MLPASYYAARAKGKEQARWMAKQSREELERVTVDTWFGGFRYLFPDERTDSTAYKQATMLAPFRRKYGTRKLASITAVEAQRWTLAHPQQVRWLRFAWTMAVQMQVVPLNVWLFVVMPKRTKPRPKAPSEEQLERILAACRERDAVDRLGTFWESFANMIEVAAFTGAREGGLMALPMAAVDLDERRMTVVEKGNKKRTIILAGRAHEAMRRQFEIRERQGWAPKRVVFVNSQMRVMRTGEVMQISWRKVRGDFPHGFHALKHYATTWLSAQGVDPMDIAVQLGHVDSQGRPYADLIERVYNHPDPEAALARIAAKLS